MKSGWILGRRSWDSRLSFGKFKGRLYQEAAQEAGLRSWLVWLADSSNEKGSAMGQRYLGQLERHVESSRALLAALDQEYGIAKSKVDAIRSKLFSALRPLYQERERLRLLVRFRKGSTRALACGFQRPR